MKENLASMLICPACLPDEVQLRTSVQEVDRGDIEHGELCCPECRRVYPIVAGIADLVVEEKSDSAQSGNKYETTPVLSSYLWSHYGDLLKDDHATDAYARWARLMDPHPGLAIDAGAAVGRFSFEMSGKADMVVGVDNSRSFIRTARELLRRRTLTFPLKQEGNLSRETILNLEPQWDTSRVEFIVADALALPFRAGSAGSFSSLNLIDKVPSPLRHLQEMNRVTRVNDAQFLLSDPFSWSEEAAREEEWLGGTTGGPFPGRGLDNIAALLGDEPAQLPPAWQVQARGEVWWRIRTHANHFELIRSCYLKAKR